MNFIIIKRRIYFIEEILKIFLEICSNQRGEITAKFISSKELSISEQKKIQSELSKDFKSSLNIDYIYDPDLIAGHIVQVGSLMIDTSVKSKLQQIENKMIEA